MRDKEIGYPSEDKPWLKYYKSEDINAGLPECTIYEYLYNNNKSFLNETALNYFDRKITYGILFENIEKAACAFTKIGIKAEDIVILCLINMPETVYSFYALNRLGAISNMVDPRTSVEGLNGYIRECKANIVITVEQAYEKMVEATKGTDIKSIISVSPVDSLSILKRKAYYLKHRKPELGHHDINWKEFIAGGEGANPKYAKYQKNRCSVIEHTGGTTGIPKGVMLSDDNLNAVADGYSHLGIPFKRQQKYFDDLPPFIIYGLCLAMHTTLCHGLEVILYPIFDSKGFPKLFAKYRPQHFSALADHLYYLTTDHVTKNMDMSFLITAAIGGDSLNSNIENDINDFLRSHKCGFEIVKGYGMTEASATICSTFKEANALGSVGIPLVHNVFKIMDLESGKELPVNKTGEIWISGPSVMLGYYEKPEDTKNTMITDENGNRWIKTGDLGHMSSDGLLFHEGRIRRIYLTAVEGQPAKIFPMPVENAIKQSANVFDCSVVGRTKNKSAYYESVAFVIKKNTDATDQDLNKELSALCKNQVPSYMCPVEYRFVTDLPHTMVGKIDFQELERMAADR